MFTLLSSLKTGGGVAQMVHVASSWRSCGDEAKDGRVAAVSCIRLFAAMGCIRLFYPNITIFIVLCLKGSLVISLSINRTPRAGG
jgi:hypothetical protein